MNIPLNLDHSKSQTLHSTNRDSLQTSLYFQNYQSFDATPHASHGSQNMSASLHSSDRVTILQPKDTAKYSDLSAHQKETKDRPITEPYSIQKQIKPSYTKETPKLAENLDQLKHIEDIRYQESGESDQEDEMPELVQEKLSDFPRNISNLSKDEFIRMMMRESYHSQAEHSSQKGDIKTHTHDSVFSKKSLDAYQKHESNQSHVNIISNSSSKNSLRQ